MKYRIWVILLFLLFMIMGLFSNWDKPVATGEFVVSIKNVTDLIQRD